MCEMGVADEETIKQVQSLHVTVTIFFAFAYIYVA